MMACGLLYLLKNEISEEEALRVFFEMYGAMQELV